MQTRQVNFRYTYPDGSPAVGVEGIFDLNTSTLLDAETVLVTDIKDTTDHTGHGEVLLWCNDDGLTPTHYVYTQPDGKRYSFTLLSGITPLSIETVLTAGMVPSWSTPDLNDALESFREEFYSGTGSGLIGYIARGVGAIQRTVQAKLRDRITTSDYDTFAHAVDDAAWYGKPLMVDTVCDLPAGMLLTVPATVELHIVEGGQLYLDVYARLTVLGAFTARRVQVFAGPGIVDMNDAQLGATMPEWWGARAGVDSTAAFQKAADAHLNVLGDGITPYELQSDLLQFTPKNLHRIKHPMNDPTNGWANGIWVAVVLRSNALIRNCKLKAWRVSNPNGLYLRDENGEFIWYKNIDGVVTVVPPETDGAYRKVVKTGKGTFCFGVGNPNHLDPDLPLVDTEWRGERATITQCEFLHFDFPTNPAGEINTDPITGLPEPYEIGERYKAVVGISINHIEFMNNRLIGHYARNSYIGVYCFDVETVTYSNVYGERVFCGLCAQYVQSVTMTRVVHYNSRQFIDADAYVDHCVVSDCSSTRENLDTATDDSVWEFNGVKRLIMSNNVTDGGHRGVTLSTKAHLYKRWRDVREQPAETAENTESCIWGVCLFTGNVWRNIAWQVYIVGSNWNSFPHEGQPTGQHLIIEHDVAEDTGYLLDSGEEHASYQVYEASEFRITPQVTHPTSVIHYLTAPAALGAQVLTLDSVDGLVVLKKLSCQLDLTDIGDDGPPRKHELIQMTAINPTTKQVTLAVGISWTMGVGNSVRGGGGGGHGFYLNSYIEGQGVGEAHGLCKQAAAADTYKLQYRDDPDPLLPNGPFVKFANVIVQTDDEDIEDWTTQLVNVDNAWLTFADPLPASVSVDNKITQLAATGAGVGSALSGTIGGYWEGQGIAAGKIVQPSRIHFDDLTIRNSGRHGGAGNKRQLYIRDIQGEYTRPGNPPALVTGRIDIEDTEPGITRYGLLVQAGDVEIPPNPAISGWAKGMWSLLLNNSRIVGHAATTGKWTTAVPPVWVPDETYDLMISDTGAAGTGQSLENIRIVDSEIGTTNINVNVNSPIGLRMPLHMAGPSAPISQSAINVASPRGAIIWNTLPALGAPIGWICIAAGTPGTWMAFGAFGVSASKTWVRPSDLGAGSTDTTLVTCAGALVGRACSVGITPVAPATVPTNMILTAQCKVAGTIEVVVWNRPAAPWVAGTFTVSVAQS